MLGSLAFIPSVIVTLFLLIFGGIAIVIGNIMLGMWIAINVIAKSPFLLYELILVSNRKNFKFYVKLAESFHKNGISLNDWIDIVYTKKKKAIAGIVDKIYFFASTKENHYIALHKLLYKLQSFSDIECGDLLSGYKLLDTMHANHVHTGKKVHALDRVVLLGQFLVSWLYANKLITRQKFEEFFSDIGNVSLRLRIPFDNEIKSALIENINNLNTDDVELRKIAIKQTRENRFAIIKGFYRQILCPKITIE
jgi:hypothetical protein